MKKQLEIITIHNEEMLKKVDGDQGRAVGLIDFYDVVTGVSVWNPFYDVTLINEVVPTEEYSRFQLKYMLDRLHPAVHWDTGGNCTANVYKLTRPAGEVKSIVVTDDCIVGYADEEPFEVDEPTEVWVRHLN